MADETPDPERHPLVPQLPPERPAMLQMDGIRIATLITLGAHTVAVIVLWVYLMTNVQEQRLVNECYQELIDATVAWANVAAPAAQSDRQAQRELLWAQLAQGDGRAAVERYIAQLDEADRTRTTAPPPAQRCAR